MTLACAFFHRPRSNRVLPTLVLEENLCRRWRGLAAAPQRILKDFKLFGKVYWTKGHRLTSKRILIAVVPLMV
jgi:hypothetical protein